MARFFNQNNPKIDKFLGYRNREDEYNLPPGFLVSGSKNVLTYYKDKVGIRKGYTQYGLTPTNSVAVASFDFNNPNDLSVKNIKVIKDNTNNLYRVQYINPIDKSFIEIYNYSSVNNNAPTFAIINNFSLTSQWSPNLQINSPYLIWSNSSLGVVYWSGATATITSNTATTITLSGDATRLGFLKAGSVIVNENTYTYTGISGNQLTGLTSLPTLTNFLCVNSPVVQNLPTLTQFNKIDIISNFNNHLYVADSNKSGIAFSKANTISDFSFSTIRQIGEGGSLYTSEAVSAFTPTEKEMYVHSKNTIREIIFNLSPEPNGSGSIIYYESIVLSPIKIQQNQGALEQRLTSHINDNVVYVSNEPNLNTLGNVIRQQGVVTSLLDNVSLISISEPIRNDFINYNFSGGSLFYFQNYLYIAVPLEGIVLMWNLTEEKWETPQTIPVSCFSNINGEIYGHSAITGQTFKLFDGNNDNGFAIEGKAIFSWQNYNQPDIYKTISEIYTKGRINSFTIIDVDFVFDNDTTRSRFNNQIDGANYTNFKIGDDSYIGSSPIGKNPIGSTQQNNNTDNLLFYNNKINILPTDFLQYQLSYSSNTLNAYWEIITTGSNTTISRNIPVNIYQP